MVGRSGAKGNVKNGAFAVLAAATGLSGPGTAELGGGRVALRDVEIPAPVGDDARPRMFAAQTTPTALPTVVAAPSGAAGAAGRRLSFSALSTLQTCA